MAHTHFTFCGIISAITTNGIGVIPTAAENIKKDKLITGTAENAVRS